MDNLLAILLRRELDLEPAIVFRFLPLSWPSSLSSTPWSFVSTTTSSFVDFLLFFDDDFFFFPFLSSSWLESLSLSSAFHFPLAFRPARNVMDGLDGIDFDGDDLPLNLLEKGKDIESIF